MTLPPAAELLGAQGVGEVDFAADPRPVSTPDTSRAEPTDEHLLSRFLQGERDALGLLASRHEPHLLGLACALTGRRDLALESVQDTWLKVIKYGRSFRAGSTVKTWLYRILINACKDARSRNNRFRFPLPSASSGVIPLDAASYGATGGSPASASLNDTPDLARLRTTIDTLSGDQKLLILLCYHNGLTHTQAADVLNIPVGTLKSRLNTILTTLRTRLATQDATPGS